MREGRKETAGCWFNPRRKGIFVYRKANCPVCFGRLSPSEVIQFKSEGRAHFQCGRRLLRPAECLKKLATGQQKRMRSIVFYDQER